jgi:putative endonuclease
MPHDRQRLGAAGEAAVAARYRASGYEVVARNWRCRDGEIDLIARKGATLVFCEVKTRSSSAYGSPAAAVTADKQKRLRRLALRYLAEASGPRRRLRFDVAAVTPDSIDIIESAF